MPRQYLSRAALSVVALFAVAMLLGVLVAVSASVALAVAVAVAIVVAAALGSTIPFWLVTVGIVWQAPVASFPHLPSLLIVEAVVPLTALGLTVRRSVLGRGASGQVPRLPGSRWIRRGVAVYFAVLLLNAARVYLLHSYAHVAGTNRTFFDFAIAIGCYAIGAHYFARGLTVQSFIRVLFRLSLLVTVVGLAAAAANIPIDAGDLRYSIYGFSNGAIRIGFLEDVSIFGLAAVAAGLTGLRASWAKGLSCALFLAALYESGGRAAAVGLVGAVAIWLLLTSRVKFFLAAAAIAVGLFFALPLVSGIPQVQRLTDINSAELSADGRTLLYHDQLKAFYGSPVVGIGVGVPSNVVAATPAESAFYNAQLEVGGHTTYTSLLEMFGLAGFLPYMLAMLAALGGLMRRAQSSQAASFFLITLLALAISQVASGNGSDPAYFLVLAAAAAFLNGSARAPAGAQAPAVSADWQVEPVA